jgi:ABC-type multidrug transport system ATPase subunit
MDDIFSALDADTSKHVLDHGIHGQLADNRTRILASHHTGLCLPKADYCVILGDGTALYSGSPAELKQREGFTKHMSSHDLDDVAEDDGKSRSSSGDKDAVDGAQQTAQIFIAEESRAVGARRLKSYLQLFKVGDKLQWSWAAGFLAALLYTVALLGRVGFHPERIYHQ